MKRTLVFLISLCVHGFSDAETPKCGQTSLASNKVVGGYTVQRRSWPWVVSLNFGMPIKGVPGVRGGHICGGTLISSEWVLTAAHCLDKPGKPNQFPNSPLKEWRVTAGMHTRSVDEQKEGKWQTSTVKRFIYHKDFKDYQLYAVNDIALIQLAQPFTYSDHVRPICLPVNETLKNGWSRCYTAGWGTTSENATEYSLSLQEVPILIVNKLYCQQTYANDYQHGQHICGGDWYFGNKDACKGDSGGPLACQAKGGGHWYIAGIVSWGRGCGRKKTPGIYTNVQTYENWIIQVVKKFRTPPKNTTPRDYISNNTERSRRDIWTGGLENSMIVPSSSLTESERTGMWKNLMELSLMRRKRRVSSTNSVRKFSLFDILTNSLRKKNSNQMPIS